MLIGALLIRFLIRFLGSPSGLESLGVAKASECGMPLNRSQREECMCWKAGILFFATPDRITEASTWLYNRICRGW